jgi:predicted ribosome quality control (RQC) complex YloA/Tae2 family protein
MIQNYNSLKYQVESINIEFGDIGQIQKIYSSAYLVDITIRFPGITRHLYFGRGGGTEGLWSSTEKVPSELRKIDKLLEYLRRYISGCTFQKLEIDHADRCICIVYSRAGHRCGLYLFYAGRDLYFANHYFDDKTANMKLFKSWGKEVVAEQCDYSIFDEVGRKVVLKDYVAKEVKPVISLLDIESKRVQKREESSKKLKFLKRKEANIQKDLLKIESSSQLLDLAEDPNVDLATLDRKIKVAGIKVKFEGEKHFQRRNELYQKVKRLNKSKKLLEDRLEDVQLELSNKKPKQVINNDLKCLAPIWGKGKEKEEIVKTVNQDDYKIITIEDIDYGIGKTALGNDQMRKLWAKKDDLWFHLESGTSPHVIIKLKGNALTDEVFKNIAKLMVEAMNVNITELDLIFTPVKNLKGVKGTKGKVIFKKEKHIRVII